MHFWSPNKKLTGRRRKKEGEEEKEEEDEGGEQIQGMGACLWYGTCDFYMELYGLYGILV